MTNTDTAGHDLAVLSGNVPRKKLAGLLGFICHRNPANLIITAARILSARNFHSKSDGSQALLATRAESDGSQVTTAATTLGTAATVTAARDGALVALTAGASIA